jgi:diguanylate cyclase
MKKTTAFRKRFVIDFRFQLIFLITALASVFVGGFAVYRFSTGNVPAGLINFLIVLSLIIIWTYAWVTRDSDRAGVAVSLILSVSALTVSYVIGLNSAFWVYAVIFCVFHLSSPRTGLFLAVLVLAGIAGIEITEPGRIFVSAEQMAAYLASATTTMIFSWFFSRQNERHRKRLLHWATRDSLTGLENRRSLEHELQIAVESGKRHSRGYGLIIMDLDNFKEINDNAGHAAGDAVLQRVARIITGCTRIEDRVFRYGGDEFIIILPDIDAAGLEIVARKLVEAIKGNTLSEEMQVTVSLGGALLEPGEDRDSWNRRADQNMYKAKNRGGNRYVLGEYVEQNPA